jgi:hypothetical protein
MTGDQVIRRLSCSQGLQIHRLIVYFGPYKNITRLVSGSMSFLPSLGSKGVSAPNSLIILMSILWKKTQRMYNEALAVIVYARRIDDPGSNPARVQRRSKNIKSRQAIVLCDTIRNG